MTRRGGRLARVVLRAGLLLGGVAAVWGVHEVATGTVAQAADRPPAAPLTAVVDLLTGTLSPVLDVVTPPGSDAPADPPPAPDERPGPEHRAGTPPDRGATGRPQGRDAASATGPGTARDGGRRPADRRPAPDARHEGRRSAPDLRHDGRPAVSDTRRTAPAARGDARRPADPRRAPSRPDRRAGGGGGLDAALDPVRTGVLDPLTGALRPLTDPLRDAVLAPVAGTLRPVTDPLRDGVLAPVAGALAPVTRPLAPVLAPVWRALEPVRRPLDPVLTPLTPVTDLLDPPAGPVTTPPPPTPPPGTPAPPAGGPAGGPADGPAPHRPADAPRAPAAATDHAAGPHARPVTTGDGRSAAAGAARHHDGGTGRSSRPQPLRSDLDPIPASPAAPAGSGAAGPSGSGHGAAAVTGPASWVPPALVGHRGAPAGGPPPASRSPRPGTRPA
jgi:hypothetical protein